jgi:hypothetical protein
VVGQEGGRALYMVPNISLQALLTLGLWWDGGRQDPLHGPKYIPGRFTYSWFVVGQEVGRALYMDPNIGVAT